MEDARHPWDQRPGETRRAYAAFLAYRDMGRARSLRKVAAADPEGRSTGVFGKWNTDHGWQGRVDAWDQHLDREAQLERADEIARLRRDWSSVSRAMLAKAAEGLRSIDTSKLTAKQTVDLMDCSMRLARQAMGLPDVVVGHESSEGMEELRAGMWEALQANPDALDVAETLVAQLERMGVAPPS